MQAKCYLLHDSSWRTLLAALEASEVEVLELNCQAASMVFRSKSLLHRRTEVGVQAAMAYVAEHLGHIWSCKSWTGSTATEGVVDNARGFALMRKSSVTV